MINQPDAGLKPEPCDHVFEAEYCIKSTSLESKTLNTIAFTFFLVDCAIPLFFLDARVWNNDVMPHLLHSSHCFSG